MTFVLLVIIIFNIIIFLSYNTLAKKINIYDNPDNNRKIHSKPVPLTGGIILYANLILYFLINFISIYFSFGENYFFSSIKDILVLFFGCSAIFFIGFFDDKLNLNANKKFLLISLSILIFILIKDNSLISFVRISITENIYDLGNFSIFFTIICYLLFINSLNMFDGINLQVITFSIILIFNLLILSQNLFFLVLIVPLILCSYLNYCNKLFLGDSGSLLLSFILGFLFIKEYNSNIILFADQIAVFMLIPGLDLMRLFFMRIINKKSPFKADKNHIHHLMLNKYSNFNSYLIIQAIIAVSCVLTYVISPYLVVIIIFISYTIIIKNLSNN